MNAKFREEETCIDIGVLPDEGDIINAFNYLISKDIRQRMGCKGHTLIDGQGTNRLIDNIESLLSGDEGKAEHRS